MAYLMTLMSVVLIAVMFSVIEKKDEKNERKIEALHKEAYGIVDKYYGDCPNLARAKKAEVDVMVHDAYAEVGRKYETKNLKEVSTAKERAKYKKDEYAEFNAQRARLLDLIDEIEMASFTEEDLYPYKKVSREDGIDRAAKKLVEVLGITYEEAHRRAARTYDNA